MFRLVDYFQNWNIPEVESENGSRRKDASHRTALETTRCPRHFSRLSTLEMGKIYNLFADFHAVIVGAILMEPVKYNVTWKTLLLPLVGIVAFIVYIYIFRVDIIEILGMIRQVNIYVYLLAAIVSILDTMFFAFAWHSLLRFLSVRVSRFRAFLFVWVGIFVDTIIPAESVSGEIARIYLVNKEQSGTAGRATASVVAQRLIGMGINIGTLLIGASLLLIERQLHWILLVLILLLVSVTFLFLVLTLLLCVKEAWTMRIVNAVIGFAEWISRGRWKLTKMRSEVVEATKAFHEAIKEYVHAPRTLLVASSFSVISWILTLCVFYLTFLSMGYPQITWSAILVISAIFMAVKSIPIGVPFEVGLPEITLTTLLFFFVRPWTNSDSFAVQISATATILMRLLTLWLRFFIGFSAQQWIGIKAISSSGIQGKNNNDHK